MVLTLYSFGSYAAEIKWDGEANDGLWRSPSNWSGNVLPGEEDDVVIDNSFIQGNYDVSLGAGSDVIIIHKLSILPTGGAIITVAIPTGNTAVPAISCSATGYGLIIGARGILVNRSGATSGQTITTTDTLRIENGGKYIHGTARSHATIVSSLSRAPGTESGEFEFRIPVASSTLSVSGQVFGKLSLYPGPGGQINYTGTGTSNLTVRSDLYIAAAVNLSFNLEGRLKLGGNLLQEGGILNLASTARTLIVELGGNLVTHSQAVITETGTAHPVIRLSGKSEQVIDVQGTLTNEVVFGIDNASGARLASNLALPYELQLGNGVLNGAGHTVKLLPGCRLVPPAEPNISYLNGKLAKEGLNDEMFAFPVGDGTMMRWVNIHNASGDLTVEYIRANPNILNTKLGSGLARISGLEYWSIGASGAAKGKVEISFDNVNSGGVTDLNELTTARLTNMGWTNAGATNRTGSAGAQGAVTGDMFSWSDNQSAYYTIASTALNQNPLPLVLKAFTVVRRKDGPALTWTTDDDADSRVFTIQRSADGRIFKDVAAIAGKGTGGTSTYHHVDISAPGSELFYRLIMSGATGEEVPLKTIRLTADGNPGNGSSATGMTVYISVNHLRFLLPESMYGRYQVTIMDLSGRVLVKGQAVLDDRQNSFEIPRRVIMRGLLLIHLRHDNGREVILKALMQ